MASPTTADTSRRSKISAERQQEIFDAVLALLTEGGYEALTFEGVAARARASRSTLYRQWKSKPQLVAAALRRCDRRMALDGIDTGTLVGDLRETAGVVGRMCHSDTTLLYALGHAALNDPSLLQALHDALFSREVSVIAAMVRRAVERGEIPADCAAAEFVPAQLIGVMRVRPLLDGEPVDRDYLLRFLDASVFPALGLS
ncbi:TetR/AcrR family transcriptional regulator [Streptomyces sp. NPDC021225]|uniref:TetR/AcrR family transcriptional regulator n=1 Tax=Streptomyces sp. NPDC021225 TaxID=3365121 RepID=UPI0037A62213